MKWVRDKGSGLGSIGVWAIGFKFGSSEMGIRYGWSGLTFDYWVMGSIKIIIMTIIINKMTRDNI